jgi:hypothetical protein
VLKFGKVEKKISTPLEAPPSRTTLHRGELAIDFDEAFEMIAPAAGGGFASAPLRLALALGQPVLGALPAATKAKIEKVVGNPRVFSAAGATGLNIFLHLLALPLLATAFAVFYLDESFYSQAVRPWFMWGAVAAVAEAIWRLREAVIFARPLSDVVYRGSIYGPLLIPLVAPILKRAEAGRRVSEVAFEGYYDTGNAYDEKTERERRYGEIFTLDERPNGYLFRLELPRTIPPSGIKEELGIGDEMPDYALDMALGNGWFEVRGRVVDPRLRTIAATAPAFPPDFTTRVPVGERCAGFVQRYRDKTLEVVLLKASARDQLQAAAHAA